MKLLLNGGAYNDVRIVDEDHRRDLEPHSPSNIGGGISPTTHFVSYAGCVRHGLPGKTRHLAFGTTNGMLLSRLVPEEELGIVLLANYSGQKISNPFSPPGRHAFSACRPGNGMLSIGREPRQRRGSRSKRRSRRQGSHTGNPSSLPLPPTRELMKTNHTQSQVKGSSNPESSIQFRLFTENSNTGTSIPSEFLIAVWNPDLGREETLRFLCARSGRPCEKMDYGGFFTFTRAPDSTDETRTDLQGSRTWRDFRFIRQRRASPVLFAQTIHDITDESHVIGYHTSSSKNHTPSFPRGRESSLSADLAIKVSTRFCPALSILSIRPFPVSCNCFAVQGLHGCFSWIPAFV